MIRLEAGNIPRLDLGSKKNGGPRWGRQPGLGFQELSLPPPARQHLRFSSQRHCHSSVHSRSPERSLPAE